MTLCGEWINKYSAGRCIKVTSRKDPRNYILNAAIGHVNLRYLAIRKMATGRRSPIPSATIAAFPSTSMVRNASITESEQCIQ